MTVLLDQHPELWEKLHPHVPKETIVQTVREMTPAQRAYPYMPQAIIDATPWVEALKAV